jgi:hypothetical protein
MKTWSSERGVILIVLLIALIVLGLLGAGLASIMGSKHKSYPIHAQSYQALNVANAGIEFAARYAEDLYDPNQPANLYVWLGTPTIVNCPAAVCGKNDSFTIQYYDKDHYPSEPGKWFALTSQATVATAQRQVKLAAFPGFLGNGGVVHQTVTNPACHVIRPGTCYTDDCQVLTKCPKIVKFASKVATIPLYNMYDQRVYIKNFTMTLLGDTGSQNILQTVFTNLTSDQNSGIVLYDFLSKIPGDDSALPNPNPNIAGSGGNRGICVPAPNGTGCPAGSAPQAIIPYRFNLDFPVEGYSSVALTVLFTSASNTGWYVGLDFNYDFDESYANLKTARATFKLQ